jgi:hypothetical protein
LSFTGSRVIFQFIQTQIIYISLLKGENEDILETPMYFYASLSSYIYCLLPKWVNMQEWWVNITGIYRYFKEVDNLPSDDKTALLRVIGGFLRDVKTKQPYAS